MMALNYDRTGVNPNNLVQGELHTYVSNDIHILVPTEGVYYIESMSVLSTSTGLPVEWEPWYFDSEIFALTGKPVAVAIAISDHTTADTVTLAYQAVGGPLSKSTRAFLTLTKAIEEATTGAISWSRIVHPATFPGAPHTHEISDATELEILSSAIVDFTNALKGSGSLSISGNEISGRIDRLLSLVGYLRSDLNRVGGGAIGGLTQEQYDYFTETVDGLAEEFISLAQTQIDQEERLAKVEGQMEQFIDAISETDLSNTSALDTVNDDYPGI